MQTIDRSDLVVLLEDIREWIREYHGKNTTDDIWANKDGSKELLVQDSTGVSWITIRKPDEDAS